MYKGQFPLNVKAIITFTTFLTLGLFLFQPHADAVKKRPKRVWKAIRGAFGPPQPKILKSTPRQAPLQRAKIPSKDAAPHSKSHSFSSKHPRQPPRLSLPSHQTALQPSEQAKRAVPFPAAEKPKQSKTYITDRGVKLPRIDEAAMKGRGYDILNLNALATHPNYKKDFDEIVDLYKNRLPDEQNPGNQTRKRVRGVITSYHREDGTLLGFEWDKTLSEFQQTHNNVKIVGETVRKIPLLPKKYEKNSVLLELIRNHFDAYKMVKRAPGEVLQGNIVVRTSNVHLIATYWNIDSLFPPGTFPKPKLERFPDGTAFPINEQTRYFYGRSVNGAPEGLHQDRHYLSTIARFNIDGAKKIDGGEAQLFQRKADGTFEYVASQQPWKDRSSALSDVIILSEVNNEGIYHQVSPTTAKGAYPRPKVPERIPPNNMLFERTKKAYDTTGDLEKSYKTPTSDAQGNPHPRRDAAVISTFLKEDRIPTAEFLERVPRLQMFVNYTDVLVTP